MTNPESTARRPGTPDRPGTSDVEALEAQTRAPRAVDYQSGGGMCRDAVVVRIHRGHQMLKQEADKRREDADSRTLSEAVTAFMTSPNHT